MPQPTKFFPADQLRDGGVCISCLATEFQETKKENDDRERQINFLLAQQARNETTPQRRGGGRPNPPTPQEIKEQRTTAAGTVVNATQQEFRRLGKPTVDDLQTNAQLSVTLIDEMIEDHEVLLEVVDVYTRTANGTGNQSSLISAYNLGFFCLRLKKSRGMTQKSRGMTQKEVAGHLGISQPQVSRFSALATAVASCEWGCQFLFLCSYPWSVLKELLTGKPSYLYVAFHS